MAVRFTEAKVEKHGIAGILEAGWYPNIGKHFLSISFLSSNDTCVGFDTSSLIVNLMNEFEVDKFCKKCITNTNPVSSLDASWNNLHAHFFRLDFFPPRVNFLLTYTPAPVGNSLS